MADEPSLFGDLAPAAAAPTGQGPGQASASAGPEAPLAARMRPRTLDEFVGHTSLVGEGNRE